MNEKHLKIIGDCLDNRKTGVLSVGECLKAMQILQDEIDIKTNYYENKISLLNVIASNKDNEIDRLKQENEELKEKNIRLSQFTRLTRK